MAAETATAAIPPPLGLTLDGVESSYRAADLGLLFYALARAHAPRLVVELGTYMGYSALHLAAALRDRPDVASRLDLVDLWSRYPYRHCSMETTRANFERNGLLAMDHCAVSFVEGDAFERHADYPDRAIDLLHVDVSNTGDRLRELLELWGPKVSRAPNALVVVEGGSAERDRVAWMVEHRMAPIRDLLSSAWFASRFEHFCFQPFPSLCVLRCVDDPTA